MKFVDQLLDGKGRDVWSITPDATVYDALGLMAEKRIGALVVLEGEQLAGLFSERDYARKVILQGKSSKGTPVRDIMSRRVLCIGPEQSVQDCMALMTERRIRHLPVVADDRLVGLVSIGDVVKAVIADQEEVIEHLEHYITGSP
ncbi:MAG: CBS domain-containing protein [Rhodospirillaceae bacterium]|nr:CBS domain-containing protein [Rhodospirillaceae bacterium]